MKYAVVKVVNGNFFIDSEGYTTLSAAKTKFHDVCKTLWNAQDVIAAEVKILDEQLDCVEDSLEYITHSAPVAEPAGE